MNKLKEADIASSKVYTDLLDELFSQVTDEERKKFKRIFPDGVPDGKLRAAIQLCDRTIDSHAG